MIQRRKHRSAAGIKAKEVVEFAFLRLRDRGRQKLSYLSVLMAFKAFLHAYNLDLSCRDQVQGMLAWAHQPQALSDIQLKAFVANLKCGWQREGAHSSALQTQLAEQITAFLNELNQNLP